MKKFICCLLSVLLFTMPVYAGEIKGVEKIGGIEKIGDIPTGSITAIEKTDLEYAPSIHNVKSGLDEEYTFYSQLSDEGKQYYDALEENVMKMVNGTETVTTNITVNVGTGLDENTAINNASNIGFDGAKRGIVAFWYDNPQYFWFDINKIIFSASYYPNLSYNSENGTFLLIIKTGVNSSGTGYTNYYPEGYDTQEEVETDWNKLVKCKNELIANMDNSGSDFEKVKYWYDGYLLEDYQVYNPKAVVSVCVRGRFRSYWSETASYEAIVPFINMNYDGLKNAIIEILSGASIKVNTSAFKNDTVNIQSKDDVLTYLIHLGYLGYNQNRRTAFVPNEEIRQELTTAVESRKWNEMITFQQESEHLLEATLDMDEEAVEEGIEKIHTEYVSNIQYNNENSLSSVLAIAYLSSMEYYFKPVRELPTGRGFADFVFIPKPEYVSSYPALVVELKWNKNVKTALQQIKEKQYPDSVLDYTGDILLVGINYDKKTKEHQCLIEKYEKL